MSILYQTFGYSFKVLAGVFASLTHYFMHKSHSKQKSYTQDEEPINEQNTYLLNTITKQPAPQIVPQPTPQIRQGYPSINIETSRRSL